MGTVVVMTNERPHGALESELDRALEYIGGRFDRLDARVDGLTAQVTATNGRVRATELWQARWDGVKAGAGGSWGVAIGLFGAALGVGTLALSIILGVTR